MYGTGDRPARPAAPTSLSDACAYPQQASVSRQSIFFEPLAYRNLVDFSLQVSEPFTSYPNIVFAPHVYTYAFTVEQDLLGMPARPGGYPPNFTFGYQTAEAEAQAMHAAVFVTEFGDSSSTDGSILANELSAQEATQTGATLWAWKGLAKAPGTCWCVRWQHSSYQTTSNGTAGKGNPKSVPSPQDRLIPSRQRLLMRVWPVATAGRLGAYAFDPSSGTFALTASATAPGRRGADGRGHGDLRPLRCARRGARQRRLCTRHDGLAPRWQSPGLRADDGWRWGGVRRDGRAQRRRACAPSWRARRPIPLPPISEPTARAAALGALATVAHSTNKSVAANAQLVQGLAGVVLGSSDPNAAPAGVSPGSGRQARSELGVELGPALVLEERTLALSFVGQVEIDPVHEELGRAWPGPVPRCWPRPPPSRSGQ